MASPSEHRATQEGEAVRVFGSWLRVRLPTGRSADFHARWLRHNDDLDRHPLTGERTLDSSELPDDVAIADASLDGVQLAVTWRDDSRTSHYPVEWLEHHAYAVDRPLVTPPPSAAEAIEIVAASGDPSQYADAALARLAQHGAVVLRRGPSTETPEDQTARLIDALAAAGLRVVETHFGRIEDFRTDNTTNQNTDQLGYTDAAIALHTDQPFLDAPPRYQALQCIRAADEGGDNAIADARAASAYLASVDREAWELLTRTPVTFHRKQRSFERVVVAPILVDTPPKFLVRYSYFTMAPFKLPFEQMEAWYRAYDRFARLVRDPAHHMHVALRAGDVLLYDNHRMLHARTAFRGPRWVRGVYFDA